MIKKITSLILTISIFFSISVTSFAGESTSLSLSGNKISKSEVESIYTEQDKKIVDKSSNSDKQILLDNLHKIQDLQLQEVTAETEAEIQSLFVEINELETVVELDVNAQSNSISMSSLKPNPPSSTRYLKTYGITSYTSYGGEEYEVYEVVVYTNDTKRSNARYNPLFNWGTMNLLDDGNYTLSDFAETITYKSSYVASLFNIPYALYSTAIPPSAYFGQSVEESLIYEYDATQIFVYAYVAERGVDWYDHMQTSERLSVNSDIVSRINRYGYVEEDDLDDKILRHAESRYYADVSRPTQRYHQNKYKEEFKVGDLKVYYDGDYKGKINTNYYSELWSIPGL